MEMRELFAGADRATHDLIVKGALLDADSFGHRMGWTPRRLANAVLAHRVFFIEHEGRPFFPRFFTDAGSDRRQLGDICSMLEGLPGGAVLQFFENPRGSLNRKTPLQALRSGDVTRVKDAARGYAEG